MLGWWGLIEQIGRYHSPPPQGSQGNGGEGVCMCVRESVCVCVCVCVGMFTRCYVNMHMLVRLCTTYACVYIYFSMRLYLHAYMCVSQMAVNGSVIKDEY